MTCYLHNRISYSGPRKYLKNLFQEQSNLRLPNQDMAENPTTHVKINKGQP